MKWCIVITIKNILWKANNCPYHKKDSSERNSHRRNEKCMYLSIQYTLITKVLTSEKEIHQRFHHTNFLKVKFKQQRLHSRSKCFQGVSSTNIVLMLHQYRLVYPFYEVSNSHTMLPYTLNFSHIFSTGFCIGKVEDAR